MRFNIAYTDYKKQRISNHSINYKFKNEVKINDYKHNIDHHININNMNTNNMNVNLNVNKAFEIDYNMNEYTDAIGNINYRFDLTQQQQQYVTKKMRKLDRIVDKVCNIFFIYVNKTEDGQLDEKINIGIDENKLSNIDDMIVPDMNITMNIYDMLGITNIIDKIIT